MLPIPFIFPNLSWWCFNSEERLPVSKALLLHCHKFASNLPHLLHEMWLRLCKYILTNCLRNIFILIIFDGECPWKIERANDICGVNGHSAKTIMLLCGVCLNWSRMKTNTEDELIPDVHLLFFRLYFLEIGSSFLFLFCSQLCLFNVI